MGIITSAHGIRGAVKLKSFTQDPLSIAGYSPLYNSDASRKFDIKIDSDKGDMLVVKIKGVATRNEAELLVGTELFVYRDMLPETDEDEFYYEDLIGLHVKSAVNNVDIGVVTALYNYGAGDILEITLNEDGKTQLLAFTGENVPEVHVKEGYILINMPEIEFLGGES